MEQYRGVHGRERVVKIEQAVEAAGGTVLVRADPTTAPFEMRVKTREGEVLDLVCYAFTANEYGQGGRPDDEHRFQVKYGSEFDRAHHLYFDSDRKKVTLMFGVHDEADVFIAVDPWMHSPTWFSSSVEFKQHHVDEALRLGWHGWERERVATGRRKAHPLESLRTEAVVAFSPKHFLDYVRFEQLTGGADPGERLLTSDKVEERLKKKKSVTDLLRPLGPMPVASAAQHPLLVHLGLDSNELLELLSTSFRLLVAVRGSVAEFHLDRLLRATPGIDRVERIDEDGQPDFRLEFQRREYLLECKNVLRRENRGSPRVDFQKTRASKADPCSRYYDRKQFQILAACLHPRTEKWQFLFCQTRTLREHKKCAGKLATRVDVEGADWVDLLTVLGQLS